MDRSSLRPRALLPTSLSVLLLALACSDSSDRKVPRAQPLAACAPASGCAGCSSCRELCLCAGQSESQCEQSCRPSGAGGASGGAAGSAGAGGAGMSAGGASGGGPGSGGASGGGCSEWWPTPECSGGGRGGQLGAGGQAGSTSAGTGGEGGAIGGSGGAAGASAGGMAGVAGTGVVGGTGPGGIAGTGGAGGGAGAAGSVSGGRPGTGGAAGGQGGAGGSSVGGRIGTGGAGGAGATADAGGDGGLASCPATPIAIGPSELIDDFEDGNSRLSLRNGGVWYTYATGGSTISPPPAAAFVASSPGDASNYAGCINGTVAARNADAGAFPTAGFGGVFMATTQGAICRVDGNRILYLQLRIRSNVSVRAMLSTAATTPVSSGGTCTSGCTDHFGVTIPSTGNAWTAQLVDLGEMTQSGFGTLVAFDLTQLMTLEFRIDAADVARPFQICIDDVVFD